MDWSVLLAVVCLIVLVAYLRPGRGTWSLLEKIPGPTALPVIGTVYKVAFVSRKDRLRVFSEITRQYWPIFRTWNGFSPEVHITKAEHIEKVMTNVDLIDKADFYRFVQPWLGEGLLTSKGAKWHTRRKIITPAFHFKILDNFVEVFAEKGIIMVDKLKQRAGVTAFDIYPYITRCALDIICETAMGTSVDAQENTDSEYVSAVYSISEITMKRILNPWFQNEWIFRMTGTGKEYYRNLAVLHGFTRKVIKERKALRQKTDKGTIFSAQDDLGRKRRLAFLDLLLDLSQENQYRLSDQDLQEEVDTFMFEGHDTTAVSMCWALILLGQHPDIQEKVFEEVNGIFGGSDRQPTMPDLLNMKYLEMVIKETLRLFPSVPFIGRKVAKDTQIGGYTIPAGVTVMMHIFDCHRDPEVWPDPERFDPDNFLPERAQGRHPFAYVPFSGGSRNCIGQRFALLEEKAVLSYIVRNFKVEAPRQEISMVPELVLHPLGGVNVKLTPR